MENGRRDFLRQPLNRESARSDDLRAPRRGALLLAVAVTPLTVLPLPTAADAKTATELKAELEQLKTETRDAGDAFDRAYWQLDETEVRIDKTDKKIAVTKKQLAKAQGAAAACTPRRSTAGATTPSFEFMMGAASFDDFVTRMDYLRRIGASDAEAVADVKAPATAAELAAGRARQGAQDRRSGARVTAVRARPAADAAQGEAGRLPAREGAARRDPWRTESPRRPDGGARAQRDGLPGGRLVLLLRTRGAHRGAVAGAVTRAPTSWRREERRSSRSLSGTVSVQQQRARRQVHLADGEQRLAVLLRAPRRLGGALGPRPGRPGHRLRRLDRQRGGRRAPPAPPDAPGDGGPVNPYPYLRAME